MKKILVLLSSLFLIAIGMVWITFYFSQSKQDVVLNFEPGTSFHKISRILEDNQVISHRYLFEILARIKGDAGKLKAGEYEFSKGLKAVEVLLMMRQGKVKTYFLTIPEGYNLKEIGKLFFAKGLAQPQEWEALTDRSELIEGNPLTLEGYLFPETYTYIKNTPPETLVKQMTQLFKTKIKPQWIDLAQMKGLTLHQWVTLASIIEKETGEASERPLIASVFLNRLKIGMPLQTDPTVIYGIENFNGNLTRKNMETDSPYNTYTRPGLPPGPICSPGLASLMAVIEPAQSNFLYFVAKGNGTHYFSSTLEEHNRAVGMYQLRPSK